MVSATIAYTAVPEGKARAGIVIGGAAANGVFPLNPGTFRAQHGQVPLRKRRGTDALCAGATDAVGAQLVPRSVDIADARALATPPSLDTAGFQLVASPLPAACPPEVLGDASAPQHDCAAAAYFASLEETVRRATGADAVTAFCHVVRSSKSAAECRGPEAGYASYAHADQSVDSWSSNARALFQTGDMAAFPPGLSSESVRRALEGQRYAVISAWSGPRPCARARSVTRTVYSMPTCSHAIPHIPDGNGALCSAGASLIAARRRILRFWTIRRCAARTYSRSKSSKMAAWAEIIACSILQSLRAGTGGCTIPR